MTKVPPEEARPEEIVTCFMTEGRPGRDVAIGSSLIVIQNADRSTSSNL